MQQIIPIGIQNALADEYCLNTFITCEYLGNSEGIVYESNKKFLFPYDEEQAKHINPGSYVGSIIFDHIKDYIGIPNTGKPSPHRIVWSDLTRGLMITGKFRLLQVVSDTPHLESLPIGSYYYDKVLKKEYFLKRFHETVENKKYLYLQTFYQGILERKLYELANFGDLTQGDEVPLSTLPELEHFQPKIKVHHLERLVIERDIEDPILEKIKHLIYSIEKRLSAIDAYSMRYTKGFVVFNNIRVPEKAIVKNNDGGEYLDFSKLGEYIFNDERYGSGSIDFINNDNPALGLNISYLNNQFTSVSTTSGVPLHAFGIKVDGGNNTGESKEKSQEKFNKKIEVYRQYIDDMFYEFWERFGIKNPSQELEFSPLTTTDPIKIAQHQEILLKNGLTSKKRAIEAVHATDKKDAKKVIAEIAKEQKDAKKVSPEETEEIAQENTI